MISDHPYCLPARIHPDDNLSARGIGRTCSSPCTFAGASALSSSPRPHVRINTAVRPAIFQGRWVRNHKTRVDSCVLEGYIRMSVLRPSILGGLPVLLFPILALNFFTGPSFASLNHSDGSSHSGGHSNHTHQGLKCEKMGLCSLGKVQPFMGDIYNSETGQWGGLATPSHTAQPCAACAPCMTLPRTHIACAQAFYRV